MAPQDLLKEIHALTQAIKNLTRIAEALNKNVVQLGRMVKEDKE